MSLKDDKQQNIQMELDFSSALTGETRGVAGEETESLRWCGRGRRVTAAPMPIWPVIRPQSASNANGVSTITLYTDARICQLES